MIRSLAILAAAAFSGTAMADGADKIRGLAQTYLKGRPNTALSIGITRNGKRSHFNIGRVSKHSKRTVDRTSVYEIGSITKTVTGLLLSHAIAEGRVKESDDIRKYLVGSYPNLEVAGEPIRLLNLANMTSGLPDNLPDLSSLEPSGDPVADVVAKVKALSIYSKAAFLRDLHEVKMSEKPGGNPAHSNAAAQLLGYILENTYDEPFQSLLNRMIPRPARSSPAKVVTGYDEQGNEMPALTMTSSLASGGLRYSTTDMLGYLEHQIGESTKALTITHRPNWFTLDKKLALGYFWIIEAPGTPAARFRYSGGTYGFSSFCSFSPNRKLGIVLLSNRADPKAQADLQALANKIEMLER